MAIKRSGLWILTTLLCLHGQSQAQPEQTLEQCLVLAIQSASASTSVSELRDFCAIRIRKMPETDEVSTVQKAARRAANSKGKVEERLALERYSHDNPFVLTPYRPNYVLPASYRDKASPYSDSVPASALDEIEIQFQLSLKVLIWEDIFGDDVHLSAAYTNRSFWQAYNSDISAPFRETNHEPEFLLSFENDWELWGFRNPANALILNHQSNGRDGIFSRSWNRIMVNVLLEKDNFVMSFKPWYRLRESKSNDDNPDIEHYLGHFEWFSAYQRRRNTLHLSLRNNLRSDNRGSLELGWSFPINRRIKGYIRYFNGYGESLIDYNQSVQSLGMGVQISDWY